MSTTLAARVAPLVLLASVACTALPHVATAASPAARHRGYTPSSYRHIPSSHSSAAPHRAVQALVARQPGHTHARHGAPLHSHIAKKTSTPLYLSAKLEMLSLINAERAHAGAHPLRLNPLLDAVAQARSQDMITRHYFSHQIPGGGMVFDILDRDHVQYQMAGENIALNNYIAFYPMARTVRQTNTDLMNSPEHRANILEPKYSEIGLGMAFEHGTGKLILTEVFVQPM